MLRIARGVSDEDCSSIGKESREQFADAVTAYRNMIDKILHDRNLSAVTSVGVVARTFIMTLAIWIGRGVGLHLLAAVILFATLTCVTLPA